MDETVVRVTSTSALPSSGKYVNASYIDEPVMLIDRTAAGSVGAGTDERFYYHRNQQYSITALCDNTGAVTERYAYTAYGEPTILDGAGTTVRTASFIGNPYLYTARAYDAESGLYYFRKRMYEGRKGRFLSHDPIMYPDGANTYAGWFAPKALDPRGRASVDYDVIDMADGDGTGNYIAVISASTNVDSSECRYTNCKCEGNAKVTVRLSWTPNEDNEIHNQMRGSLFDGRDGSNLMRDPITGAWSGDRTFTIPCDGGSRAGRMHNIVAPGRNDDVAGSITTAIGLPNDETGLTGTTPDERFKFLRARFTLFVINYSVTLRSGDQCGQEKNSSTSINVSVSGRNYWTDPYRRGNDDTTRISIR